jgi:PAS domain S-box-containing protein
MNGEATDSRDVMERKKTEDTRRQRVKELDGLYGLEYLADKENDLDQLMERFLCDVVPASMQFSENVIAEIDMEEKKHANKDGKTAVSLQEDITVRGEKKGVLRIGYDENLPFIEEFEPKLVSGYARRLAKIIERIEAEKALEEATKNLERRVRERTAELEEVNRRLQVEMAEPRKADDVLRFAAFCFERSGVPTFCLDSDANILMVNKAVCKALGFSRDELLGMKVYRLDPDFPEGDWHALWEKLKGEGNLVFERQLRRKDGSIFSVELSASYIEHEEKEYVLVLAHDITGRSNVEAFSKRSAHIADNIQVGLYIYKLENRDDDRTLRMMQANQASEKLTGVPVSDIIGKTLDDIFPGLRSIGIPQKFAEIVRSQTPSELPSVRYGDERVDERIYSVKAFPLPDSQVGVAFEDITEHIHMEEELRKSVEKYSLLFNSMLDGFALHDVIVDEEGKPEDYRFLNVNPAFEKLTGLDKENIVGKTVLEVLPEIERSWIETYGKVALTGEPVHFERYTVALDKYYEVTAFSPQKGQFACNFVDVTNRTKTELAIQTLFKSTVAVIGQDFFDRVVECLCEWLGVECAIVGRIVDGCVVKATSMRVDGKKIDDYNYPLRGSPCEDVSRTGFCAHEERVCDEFPRDEGLSRLGAEGYVGTPLRDKMGNPIGILCAVSRRKLNLPKRVREVFEIIAARASAEIERIETEEALKTSQQQLQSIMDHTPMYIHVVDADNRYLLANRRYEHFFGLNNSEILGKSPRDLAPAELVEKYEAQNRKVLKEGKPLSFEGMYSRPMGGDLFIQSTKFPLYDNTGKRYAVCGIAVDITEQKKVEEDKKRLEEQLFQSQKMESIGRLAGGIAHDFNNILAGIMGYAEVLKIRLGDTESDEGRAARVILKGAQRAANLTRQLLGFARKGKYNPIPININDTIKETVNVSEKIFDKNIGVVYQFEDEILSIEADKNQLDQVLTNLIINSKDAMPNGGTILFKTENVVVDDTLILKHPEMIPGEFVKVTVSDTGTGIPKEMSELVFEPFFTTKGDKGTGLGLATVYGIVKNHNGYVHADSESGIGTSFTLYFPVTEKAKEKENGVASKLLEGKATILLVEDEDQLRGACHQMLQILGYRVLTAENGDRAARLYKEKYKEIDLVMLDLIMPVMSGKETYERMKKINKDVVVLLCSGYSQDAKAKAILEDGAKGFIQKPFSMEELSRILSETLKK